MVTFYWWKFFKFTATVEWVSSAGAFNNKIGKLICMRSTNTVIIERTLTALPSILIERILWNFTEVHTLIMWGQIGELPGLKWRLVDAVHNVMSSIKFYLRIHMPCFQVSNPNLKIIDQLCQTCETSSELIIISLEIF